ncbi:restriction modification system, type I [Methylocaldum marinum]|uniref:Restriction modification system, type I n=1 Tax=Methylocaldum marinum TaxID=1432792 RepID=A0A250KUA1_9GAMM|nr:restriction endonuclease subunit S [Methylocaldum marinum]BBA35116.1 restriction modification system, type I [Methylocaldum marinum]
MTSSVLTDFEFAPFDIIDGDRGKNYPKQNEFASEGHCLFLSATNVTKSGFDFSDCQFISEQKDAALRKGKLRRDDVVLTTRGTIGNSAYYSDVVQYEHMRINSGMVILRCDTENILPVYLYHFLRSPSFFGQVNSLRSGVAQPQLPIRDMKKIKLPLPSIKLQSQISSVLSAYDDLIENNRRRIQLLEQAARLLYKEWFVHLRFPGHEHTQIIDGVPEGWQIGTIGDLGEVITGKTPSKKKPENFGSDLPFIKTPDMHGNAIVVHTEESLSEEGAKTQANKTLPPRSILVSCIGTVGAVAFNASPAQTNQQINSIVPTSDLVTYWAYFMAKELKPLLEGMGGGATMANVNKSKFSGIKVVIPSKQLLNLFSDFAKPVFDQIENLTIGNARLAKARDLLLPKLMNGEVAV